MAAISEDLGFEDYLMNLKAIKTKEFVFLLKNFENSKENLMKVKQTFKNYQKRVHVTNFSGSFTF